MRATELGKVITSERDGKKGEGEKQAAPFMHLEVCSFFELLTVFIPSTLLSARRLNSNTNEPMLFAVQYHLSSEALQTFHKC